MVSRSGRTFRIDFVQEKKGDADKASIFRALQRREHAERRRRRAHQPSVPRVDHEPRLRLAAVSDAARRMSACCCLRNIQCSVVRRLDIGQESVLEKSKGYLLPQRARCVSSFSDDGNSECLYVGNSVLENGKKGIVAQK